MTIEARLTFATQLIREAGELAAGYFAHRPTLMRETKGPQDFVSIADREVESLIRTRLVQAFPEDGFLGEESGGRAEVGGRSPFSAPTIFLAAFPCGASPTALQLPSGRRAGRSFSPSSPRPT